MSQDTSPAATLHVVCPHCHTTNRVRADQLAAAPDCGSCHHYSRKYSYCLCCGKIDLFFISLLMQICVFCVGFETMIHHEKISHQIVLVYVFY